MTNAAVTSAAAGVGIFLSSFFVTGTDVLSALIAAVVTAAAAFGVMVFLARRKS